jgi:hypothetical protein
MTKGLNWRRAKLHDRKTLDHRWEFSEFRYRDRADRWLAAVERRQREKRTSRQRCRRVDRNRRLHP